MIAHALGERQRDTRALGAPLTAGGLRVEVILPLNASNDLAVTRNA